MSWMFPKPLTAFLTLNSMNDNWSSSMGIGNPKQLVVRIPIRKQSNLGTSMDFHSHCCIEIPSTGIFRSLYDLQQKARQSVLAAESQLSRWEGPIQITKEADPFFCHFCPRRGWWWRWRWWWWGWWCMLGLDTYVYALRVCFVMVPCCNVFSFNIFIMKCLFVVLVCCSIQFLAGQSNAVRLGKWTRLNKVWLTLWFKLVYVYIFIYLYIPISPLRHLNLALLCWGKVDRSEDRTMQEPPSAGGGEILILFAIWMWIRTWKCMLLCCFWLARQAHTGNLMNAVQ